MLIKNTILQSILLCCVGVLIVFQVSAGISQQKGVITAIEGTSVRINWGTYDGIVPGVVIDVYREKVVTHTATGERLATQLEQVGTIEVVECQLNSAAAVVVKQTDSFRVGDVLKISFARTEKPAAQKSQQEKGVINTVNNAVVTFTMGKADGVERNFYFDIYRTSGAAVHPITGAVLEAKKIYIGRLIVTSVEENYSTGQIVHREQDVKIGDKVELSKLQSSDIEVAKTTQLTAEEQKSKPVPLTEQKQPQQKPASQEPLKPILADNIVGTVKRVSGRDLFFVWKADYNFPLGRVFGIFRQVEIKHPKTGLVIEKPFIQIGTVTFQESIGELGKAFIASNDADILPNDFIGLTGGETVSSKQVITPENVEQVYTAQSSDIQKLAQDLTEQVKKINVEMTIVRTALDRLDRIDRELAVQKSVSTQALATLNEIKKMLSGEGGMLPELYLQPQSRASAERIEIPGSNTNVLRLQYTKDIGVDFQLVGNRLIVSLDVDTSGLMKLMPKTQPPDAKQMITPDSVQKTEIYTALFGQTDTTQQKVSEDSLVAAPFWKEWLGKAGGILSFSAIIKIIGGLIVIIVILAMLNFFLKKKGKGRKGVKGISKEEEGGEMEGAEEEAIEEEIIPEEEEVGTLEEEEA